MYTCTFFGHRDCPERIYDQLKTVLDQLISEENVGHFLVGNNGAFDSLVYRALKELKTTYPHITYHIVLSRYPTADKPLHFSQEDLLLPDNFESFPPRFAIDRRNLYMLNASDFVVGYVTHSFGGAAKFLEKATRQKERVFNLA